MLQACLTWLLYLGRPELEMLVFGVTLESVRQAVPHMTRTDDY